jgi:hypothetical protein
MIAAMRPLTAAALSACLWVTPALADTIPSLNLSGVTGLIDLPSGEMQPDGYLTLNHGGFGPISRNTLSFQILPRLSGSFRYVGIRQWNAETCPPRCSGADAFETYYDRNFDLRYLLLKEGKYLPSVTIGLQDFIGTGLSMAEYVAATKSFGPRLKVTAGLGFGRLASSGRVGAPFGPRPKISFGNGGLPNYDQWFRGDAAPFGGIEYQLSDKVALKAEYSPDDYVIEARERGTFDRATPFNFGIEYKYSKSVTLGAYSMHGTELGFNVSIALNPAQRPYGGMGGPGPQPVQPRVPRSERPDVWETTWLAQPDAKALLIANMNRNLVRTGLTVEQISVTGDTAQIRFRNTIYDASAQAAGRIARAMAYTMPASVEVFEIVPVANGMPAVKLVVRRSDIESLEFTPDAGSLLGDRVVIAEAGQPLPDAASNTELYPRFTWSVGPFAQTMLFNPAQPFQAVAGARLSGRFEISPGVVLSGSVTKRLVGDILSSDRPGSTTVPHVRSDADEYIGDADPGIETLTAAWYGRLAPNVYGRVTAGYLEQMFGGVSAEVLYKPVNRRWALGAEANYVAQRNTDGGLGFDRYDYQVASGFVSGYYDLGRGFEAQLDVGRYLAGDVGGTFTLMRTFQNGWKVGAFATLTNLSAEEFGEGSFDKGIKFEIPLAWFSGRPTRSVRPFTLRPLGRDGGAQLQVNDRLVDTLRGYDRAGFDDQWGRFWK